MARNGHVKTAGASPPNSLGALEGKALDVEGVTEAVRPQEAEPACDGVCG